jgi:spermidine synthase
LSLNDTETRAPSATLDLPEATLSELDGVRYLHLGSIWVQGAMRIRKPQAIELDYIRRMLASLLWLPTEALAPEAGHRALQLGLGAGAITRFTQKALGWPTTVVEINPDVVAANRVWFHLPADTTVVQADAGVWLRTQAAPGSAHLLHVDLYDHDAAAPVLDDEAFYADCRRVLAEGGVMAVNLFGRASSFSASIARIAAAFGSDQVWSLRPTREGNTVVVAGRGVVVPDAATLTARAQHIEQHWGPLGLLARKWLRMVRPYQPEKV